MVRVGTARNGRPTWRVNPIQKAIWRYFEKEMCRQAQITGRDHCVVAMGNGVVWGFEAAGRPPGTTVVCLYRGGSGQAVDAA